MVLDWRAPCYDVVLVLLLQEGGFWWRTQSERAKNGSAKRAKIISRAGFPNPGRLRKISF